LNALAVISSLEVLIAFAIGISATIFGGVALEKVGDVISAARARKAPLRRLYWQVTYPPGDETWAEPWSIELVEVHRHRDRVTGTMYRVYPDRFERRWEFQGWLVDSRHLVLTYRSVGEDYGANGTLTLEVLSRWIWSGTFKAIPDPERDAALRGSSPRSPVRRIGPDFTEEALMEWIAADRRGDDEVRTLLASIPPDSEIAPAAVARHLPRRARRVLLEPPPYFGWLMRGLQYASGLTTLLGIYATEQWRQPTASPGPWRSPSKELLGSAEDDEVA
jgi:hypothetical protein